MNAPATAPALPSSLLDLDETLTRYQESRIAGVVELGPQHWIWPQHFPGDPIFPGSLLVEAAGQLVALWAWAAGHRGRPRLVRAGAACHHPVTPAGPRLELEAEVRARRHLQFGAVEVRARGVEVARIEVVLAVLA